MKRPTHDRPDAAVAVMDQPPDVAPTANPGTPANVVLSVLSGGDVSLGLLMSIVDLLAFDTANHRRIFDGGGRIFRHASVNISGPRNSVVREFLAGPADWLWMIDADMTFPPDALERLLASADPVNAPIVGGLCFGSTEGVMWPTMYDLVSDEHGPGFMRWTNVPENTMVQVTATGGACLLVHRDALTAIGEKFAGPYPWFQETSLGNEPMGEDFTFCLRAGMCEIPVYVHTGVKVGHVKATHLNYDRYVAQLATSAPEEPK